MSEVETKSSTRHASTGTHQRVSADPLQSSALSDPLAGGPTAHVSTSAGGWPRKDKFNRGGLKNNSGDLAHRVGVKIRLKNGKLEDEFAVTSDARVRYGDGEKTNRVIEKGARVHVNYASPRKMRVESEDGIQHTGNMQHVFVHKGKMGGGWIPAKCLSDTVRPRVLKEIRRKGKDVRPEPGLNDMPSAGNTEEWKIKPAAQQPQKLADLGQNIGSRILPGETSPGPNKTEHQFYREIQDGAGYRVDSANQKDAYVPVLMNLPRAGTDGENRVASFQNDIARPGESFHVRIYGGKLLRRKAPTFDFGEKTAKGSVSYLYGYVGKDHKRRGWVVEASLEKVSQSGGIQAPPSTASTPTSPP